MFQSLQVSQLQQICSYMKYRTVTALEMIIQEGEKGTEMYIVDRFDASSKINFCYSSPYVDSDLCIYYCCVYDFLLVGNLMF